MAGANVRIPAVTERPLSTRQTNLVGTRAWGWRKATFRAKHQGCREWPMKRCFAISPIGEPGSPL